MVEKRLAQIPSVSDNIFPALHAPWIPLTAEDRQPTSLPTVSAFAKMVNQLRATRLRTQGTVDPGNPDAVRTEEVSETVDLPELGSISEAERLVHQDVAEGLAAISRTLSHRINNVLAVSMGNLALLKRELPAGNGEATAILSDVFDSLQRFQQLSADLSSISHWHQVRSRRIGLEHLLARLETSFGSVLGPSKRFVLSMDGALPEVDVDPQYLELAINALLVHARDASVAEEVRLHASVAPIRGGNVSAVQSLNEDHDTPTSMVLVGVEMASDGLSADDTADAFRSGGSFRMTSSSILGLWLVKQFALASRGDVVIERVATGRHRICLALPALQD